MKQSPSGETDSSSSSEGAGVAVSLVGDRASIPGRGKGFLL
jgi:hypothetical protein